MRRFVFPLVLLLFAGSLSLFSFLATDASADTTVHRKTPQHDVELYVTSW